MSSLVSFIFTPWPFFCVFMCLCLAEMPKRDLFVLKAVHIEEPHNMVWHFSLEFCIYYILCPGGNYSFQILLPK
jgi:hypothetical protein